MNDESFDIIAERLNEDYIYYSCPYCFSKYKQDGSPYKSAKPIFHIHGNDEKSDKNRIIHRGHHAVAGMIGKSPANVNIHITDNTLKLIAKVPTGRPRRPP